MKYADYSKPSFLVPWMTALFLGASPGVTQDHLQLPSLAQDEPNLLKPFTEIAKTFHVGGNTANPYQVVEGDVSWETFGKRVYQSGPTLAFLSFDNVMTVLGPVVHGNLTQVLTVPVSTASSKSYGTKVFLSLGAENLLSAFSNELVLKVRVKRQDPASPGNFHNDDVNLYGGMHIVNRSSGSGHLFQDPLFGYFKKWNGGSYFYYTLFLPLDPAYFHWPIQEIQIIYSDPFPSSSIQKPNIHLRGLNIETAIQIQPFLSFSQFDQQWRNTQINGGGTMENLGCVVTSAAMAMRAIGLDKGPDGRDITPGTLLEWLNGNSGFAGKSPMLTWPTLTEFTNAAMINGYNNGKSMSLTHYRQKFSPNLDANQKRVQLEEALASRYPVMLRVPSGHRNVDNERNRDAHTILAYGLVPDFEANISGTYQVNDPGVSSSPQNLWRRAVGNSDWKGKWLFGTAAKPVQGSVVLPNRATIVLHSPGKIFVEGATSHYKIGYSDGVNFTNTFPKATYEFVNPNENFGPGIDNDPEPGAAEDIQVIQIEGRPNEPLNVKVVGTGTGPYTLTIDEKVWRNQNLEEVHSDERAGTLSPGAIVSAAVPASGYGHSPELLPPTLRWELVCALPDGTGPWIVRHSGAGNINLVDVPYKRGFIINIISETFNGLPLDSNLQVTVTNNHTGATLRAYPRGGNNTTRYWEIGAVSAGMYTGTITVVDFAGKTASFQAAFNIGWPVKFYKHPGSKIVSDGSSVQLQACARANPPPTFKWFKNGIQITQGASYHSLDGPDMHTGHWIACSDLSLGAVNLGDFGQYYAIAYQGSGTPLGTLAQSTSAQLDVIPANPPVVMTLRPKNLIRGGTVRISGDHFGHNKESIRVVINGQKFQVKEVEGDEIKFRVPPTLSIGPASLQVEVYGVVSTNTLNTKVAASITPALMLLLQ